MKEGIHHRILMALVGVGLVLFIQFLLSQLVNINEGVKINRVEFDDFVYALIFAAILLILGLILSISVYRKQEWARKGIIFIAVILLAVRMDLMLNLLTNNLSHLKRMSGDTDPMVTLGYRIFGFAGFAICFMATIYFAMAYPRKEAEREPASSPESLPSAR